MKPKKNTFVKSNPHNKVKEQSEVISTPVANNRDFTYWIIVLFSLLFCLLIWKYVFRNTYEMVFNYDNAAFYKTVFKRSVLLFLSIILLIVSYYFIFKTSIRDGKKNMLLLLYSFVIFFLTAEIIFHHLPISQGSGEAYCMRIWFKKYWHKNEMGFRDEPYDIAKDSAKNKIVIVGDSYVAGHGIKNPEQRFTNLLEKKLGANYRVFNLGKNGANTKEEFNLLRPFPYSYDKLILVHVPNDLEYIVKKDDNVNMDELQQKNGFFKQESFFINFLSYTIVGHIYNSIASIFTLNATTQNKPEYAFSNEADLKLHIQNLHYMDSAIQKNNIKFLVLSFPFPSDVDPIARKYYNLFIEQLKVQHINYLDAAPICDLLSSRKQIVSTLDRHPSKEIQKMVADSLYQKLKKDKWIE